MKTYKNLTILDYILRKRKQKERRAYNTYINNGCEFSRSNESTKYNMFKIGKKNTYLETLLRLHCIKGIQKGDVLKIRHIEEITDKKHENQT